MPAATKARYMALAEKKLPPGARAIETALNAAASIPCARALNVVCRDGY